MGRSNTARKTGAKAHHEAAARRASAAPASEIATSLDRLLHADLLAAAGRYTDALHWYSTLGTGAASELPLVGFAALGMARTYERMGDRAEAAKQYRRVADLWRGADVPLKQAVDSANRRSAALAVAATR